jgi:hypothetical protein
MAHPIVQQAVQQGTQIIQQQGQQLQQAGEHLALLTQENQQLKAANDLKAQENSIKEFEAQTDRIRAVSEAPNPVLGNYRFTGCLPHGRILPEKSIRIKSHDFQGVSTRQRSYSSPVQDFRTYIVNDRSVSDFTEFAALEAFLASSTLQRVRMHNVIARQMWEAYASALKRKVQLQRAEHLSAV